MKHYCKILALLLLITACELNSNNSDIPHDTYDPAKLYQHGEYTIESGQYYKAVTAVKGLTPSRYTISQKKPMNPWSIVSEEEFNNPPQPSISSIPAWKENQAYLANDIVTAQDSYYRAVWWNQNQDPSEEVNQNKNPHWGPWMLITREAAEELLPNPNVSAQPEIEPDEEPSGGTVDPDTVELYTWSPTVVYMENMVAVLDGKFYRSKWWNQDHRPDTPYEHAWDSPWEEISEERFLQIINGTTPPPPPIDPTPNPNPNPNPNPTPTPTPDAQYEQIVTQGFIREWNWADEDVPAGVREAFDAAAVVPGNIFAVQDGQGALNLFSQQINAAKWEQLFPRRRGAQGWIDQNPGKNPGDYYSFDNFSEAMLIIGEYAYMRDVALDSTTDSNGSETSFERNYVLHKPTKTIRLISQSADYFAEDPSWLTSRIHRKKVVDYAAFGREGSDNDKKRVVAGFLAHASHETSGSWATAPDYAFNKDLFVGATFPDYITDRLPGELAWSLYFNEEVAYAGATSSHYNDPFNKIFPPTPGQSYHGRGAFQLTWNYNYGLASAIFFGDSNVLLDDVNFIINGGTVPANANGTGTWRSGERIEGGTMAFLTSLMFWLTPQGAKPSQQDTMILNRSDGRYVVGTSKLEEDPGLGEPGYGWTINIMNGGYEANKSWEPHRPNYDAKVARRVKHYLFFTQALGGNNDGEVLDTYGNHSY